MAVNVKAQCDTIANICEKHLTNDYISDGQQYRALLLDDEMAEFHATFYGGAIYRIAACSGLDDGNLVFSLKDRDGNDIFNNENFQYAPYWDFQVNSTFEGILNAKLNPNKDNTSGCAVLLISFKEQ
ncbi:MAG: hypothetical protein MRY83_20995 [Flavobacteriales bacterium]|nr:hypothetical protein [Flavobacteriales bacterium]